MNYLIEQGYVKEMPGGSNFSYVLNDNNIFLTTEYKVLQGQSNKCFVKCMKMLFNGKIQLYYFTEGLVPLSEMISFLDENTYITVISNLLGSIVDVKNNGFLACENIDISLERIFVEKATLKVGLLYLPLSKKMHTDYEVFENKIRTELIKLLNETPLRDGYKISKVIDDLANGMLGMEDIYRKIMIYSVGKTNIGYEENSIKSVRLIAINAPIQFEMEVVKDSFVIGKNPAVVDGVIPINKMISRVHCRIDKTDSEYTITDLGSANGTYVNWNRIEPNQSCAISDGDIVKLANSEFKVCIK